MIETRDSAEKALKKDKHREHRGREGHREKDIMVERVKTKRLLHP
jgi:hypothetical protein